MDTLNLETVTAFAEKAIARHMEEAANSQNEGLFLFHQQRAEGVQRFWFDLMLANRSTSAAFVAADQRLRGLIYGPRREREAAALRT